MIIVERAISRFCIICFLDDFSQFDVELLIPPIPSALIAKIGHGKIV
jgi:hypothetical protein